jgi:glycosidase
MLDYPEQATAVMLNLLGSHDTARPMSVALGEDTSNQDPNAKPLGGAKDAGFALDSLKLMAAMQFTFEGAPCIYYGDEIGMRGGKDPDCRRCYPWHKPEDQNRDLFDYYQKLIAIRKANPALRAGSFQPFLVDNARSVYAFERVSDGNRCFVVLNRSGNDHDVKLPARVSATELITGQKFFTDEINVPARAAIILRVNA